MMYIDQTRYDAFANPNHHIDRLMFVAQGMNYDKVMALKRNIDAAIGPSGLNVLYVMWQAERMKVICDHLNITLTIIVARPRRLSVSAVFCRTPARARASCRAAPPVNIIINIKQLARRHAEQVTPTPAFCCSD